jgi:hypothetical protein
MRRASRTPRQLIERAEAEGVSANQLAVALLAKHL